jgi:hypothetical protein
MIAARLVRGCHRFRDIHPGDQRETVAERFERFGDERELEIRAFLQRAPVTRRRTVRMPDSQKALHRSRRSLMQRRLRRDHGVEQRNADSDARSAENRTTWNEFFGNEHS